MIAYLLVCSHCGNQTQIKLDEKDKVIPDRCFEISVCVGDLNNVIKGNAFGKAYKSLTFCDKECFVEYVKNNMNDNGTFKEKGQ